MDNACMEQGTDDWKSEIAAAAARLVVEDGLEYGPAKRQAVRVLGLPPRSPLPGNDLLEDAVFEHIAIFCADTQPQELAALRALAARWMERLAPFRPHLSSAVWRGSATRQSDIVLELYCDDSKSAEIALIDARVAYEPRTVHGMRGDTVEALSIADFCPDLKAMVSIHLLVYDHDDLRGALRHDAKGRTPRGDLAALRELLRNQTP
jgi:hypothetical protein